jgi:hypothetical protein
MPGMRILGVPLQKLHTGTYSKLHGKTSAQNHHNGQETTNAQISATLILS